MVESLTLTALTIANLAFQKFLESGAGELGKKFTTVAIAAMDSLRKKLWDRLRGKSEKLDQALAQAEQGEKKALETIAKNLDVEMDDDETFATEIKTLAQQIRSTVPIRLTAMGKAESLTFSNNKAGPPACNIRLAISATSRSRSTGAVMRRNCPRSSSSWMNPRKSLAMMIKTLFSLELFL